MRFRPLLAAPLLAVCFLSGCVSRPAPPPPAAYVPPPPVAPDFAGYGNLAVPPRLADGGYATPNRLVSPAGAVWHLRAGLNVAALACRGPDEAVTVAGYNALLADGRPVFADAYRALAQEYGGTAAFDAAMTRLYNYYALPPAQAGLCAAARAVLADAAALPPAALADFAPGALARLDAPFVAVFAAQDAWLAGRFAAGPPVMTAQVAATPRLAVDPAVFARP